MDTISKLQEISLRLDQIDQTSDWLAQCLEELDPAMSQAGTMVAALSDDVRMRVLELVSELENQVAMISAELESDTNSYH